MNLSGIRVSQLSKPNRFVIALDPKGPPAGLERAVFAIGNFDGAHLGHRAVIDRTKRLAAELDAPSAVLTFEPHPADFFAGKPVVFRLTPKAAKARALEEFGLDGAVILTFGAALAALSAEQFVRDVLVERLGVAAVVIGWDFHFGKGRSGSPAFLQRAGEAFGFSVEIADKIEDGGEIVSSSVIRQALERGDVEEAARKLGRNYCVSGVVVSGQRLGRTLGVPTANLVLPATNRLAFGVYAVRVRLGERPLQGVASFGVRPTVDNGAPCLETYIFDFDEDIYGRGIEVEIVARIRPELKFRGLEELKAAMQADMLAARQLLGSAG
jgi:riboflavin kinase / FMN adenylyltransferase